MIVMQASKYYFKLRFDKDEFETDEPKEIIKNIKECVPHGKGGRMYFPEKKEWRIHFRYWGDFIFILSQYKIGEKYLMEKVFKKQQQEIFSYGNDNMGQAHQ